jgi:hypothetical protein
MPRGESNWRLALAIALGAVAVWLAVRPSTPQPPERFGYRPDPEGTKAFLAELDKPYFAQAGEDVIRQAKQVDTFLYRPAQKAHQALYGKEWIVGRQGIGDCVSWGWAHGIWIALCVDWETGKIAEPPAMVATESVYGGSRVEARGRSSGGWSDGSYGGAAAKWARDWGAAFRLAYDAKDGGHDLREYDSGRAKSWGNYGNGGQGDDGTFDAVAKRHPCKHVALVKSFKEAAAAIESGFPVPVCSGYGFSSQRDDQAFSRRQGAWAHCMVFCAVRYGERPGLLCLNSWGPSWVKGPKWPADMPEGSFWVDASTVDGMLSGGDSFAVGSVDGFRWRDLHHGNWFQPPPISTLAKPKDSDR